MGRHERGRIPRPVRTIHQHLLPGIRLLGGRRETERHAAGMRLGHGNVEFPEDRFSWKKESGAPQCEDGCAFQDKVFTVDGFDSLCITHCGEIDGMLKDASKGQRTGVELAQRVVRQPGGTMLSELHRRVERQEQAHEPWNVDSASFRTGRMERSKYIQLRKERYDRGETASARFPSDDKYPLLADWGMPSRRPSR